MTEQCQEMVVIADEFMSNKAGNSIDAHYPPSRLALRRLLLSRIDPWESTNITVLGDAIHNMPPVGGLGGNMALSDAWSLAQALTEVQQGRSALRSAIERYEAEMRTYSFAAVRAA